MAGSPLIEGKGMEDRYGTWSVTWRTDDFLLPAIGSFCFQKMVLPLEIVLTNVSQMGLFCKNPRCLRRIAKADVEKGIWGCTHCAAGNDPGR